MAMGRQKDGQGPGDLMVSWSEMPRSPGHVFYDRLQSVLIEAGFDAFAEASCRPYDCDRQCGRPDLRSLAQQPGRERPRERIRQIEAKARRKLKHPSRSWKFRSFLES